jgi:hypothetical protein
MLERRTFSRARAAGKAAFPETGNGVGIRWHENIFSFFQKGK